MTRSVAMRPLLETAVAGALALSLSGCISLLPKAKPAQLYRFGFTVDAPAAATPVAAQGRTAPVAVYRANGQFQREAAGDRILTISGERAAYVAASRWVAPAEVLFAEAVVRAFEASPGPARLVSHGEPVRSEYALRLDVRNFETRYAAGGAPTVLVRVRAVLARAQTRAAVGEQVFEARVPASDNRVGAIVRAYDQAVAQVLGEVVTWTDGAVS
jgi:cholesterol transport system auxiliary component